MKVESNSMNCIRLEVSRRQLFQSIELLPLQKFHFEYQFRSRISSSIQLTIQHAIHIHFTNLRIPYSIY
jgi:hypothetical protein